MPRFVKHIHAHRPHVVVEHVGTLQVIVIFKRQIQPCRTVLRLVVHHVAGHRQGTGYQPAPLTANHFLIIYPIRLIFSYYIHIIHLLYVVGVPYRDLPPYVPFRWERLLFTLPLKTHGVRTGCLSRRHPSLNGTGRFLSRKPSGRIVLKSGGCAAEPTDMPSTMIIN